MGSIVYRIVFRGSLDPSWTARLGGMHVSERCTDEGEPETVLVGRLPDQAAMSSVLNALYELNFPVASADRPDGG